MKVSGGRTDCEKKKRYKISLFSCCLHTQKLLFLDAWVSAQALNKRFTIQRRGHLFWQKGVYKSSSALIGSDENVRMVGTDAGVIECHG